MFFLKSGSMLCGFSGAFISCNSWFYGFSWFCDFLVQKKLRPDANGLICIFAAIFVCLAHVEGKELQNNTCMQTDSLIALCLMSQRES